MSGLATIDALPLGLVTAAILLTLSTLVGDRAERWLRVIGMSAVMIALAALAANMRHTVRPGTVAVEVLHGQTQPEILHSGPHAVHPFADFHEMVIRRQSLEFSGPLGFQKTGSGGQTLSADIIVHFRMASAAAPYVYELLGPDAAYIPKLRQAVRAAINSGLDDALANPRRTIDAATLTESLSERITSRVTYELTLSGFTEEQARTVFIISPPEIQTLEVGPGVDTPLAGVRPTH